MSVLAVSAGPPGKSRPRRTFPNATRGRFPPKPPAGGLLSCSLATRHCTRTPKYRLPTLRKAVQHMAVQVQSGAHRLPSPLSCYAHRVLQHPPEDEWAERASPAKADGRGIRPRLPSRTRQMIPSAASPLYTSPPTGAAFLSTAWTAEWRCVARCRIPWQTPSERHAPGHSTPLPSRQSRILAMAISAFPSPFAPTSWAWAFRKNTHDRALQLVTSS